jgi:hypothetical protein
MYIRHRSSMIQRRHQSQVNNLDMKDGGAGQTAEGQEDGVAHQAGQSLSSRYSGARPLNEPWERTPPVRDAEQLQIEIGDDAERTEMEAADGGELGAGVAAMFRAVNSQSPRSSGVTTSSSTSRFQSTRQLEQEGARDGRSSPDLSSTEDSDTSDGGDIGADAGTMFEAADASVSLTPTANSDTEDGGEIGSLIAAMFAVESLSSSPSSSRRSSSPHDSSQTGSPILQMYPAEDSLSSISDDDD